jgi:hypothetical protein
VYLRNGAASTNSSTPHLVRNNLWDWQLLQPTSGPGAAFFRFCDALEVKDGNTAPATGWGLDHALPAWGAYFKNTYLPTRNCRLFMPSQYPKTLSFSFRSLQKPDHSVSRWYQCRYVSQADLSPQGLFGDV